MGLGLAHKGYEYQDLLSGLYIIECVLNDVNAIVKIDKKESHDDKFDDFTLISSHNILKRQIKYSDNKVLSKADLSTSSYDLALDTLFKSWQSTSKSLKTEFRICLAWEYIENNDDLDFLSVIEVDNIYNDENVRFLKFNIDQIWEEGQQPKSTWRRLRSCLRNSDREEFALFLNDVIIEVNLPKASNDIANPAALEKIVFSKLKQFGVGKYPNQQKTVEDVLLNLTHIVKNSRATGEELKLKDIAYKLGLKNNYGNIAQNFDIDQDLNVANESRFHSFNDFVYSSKKTIVIGEPGSGKSWFIQNYINFLKQQNIKVIQHYCYTGLDDIYEKERITINIFLANLINDILFSFPELKEKKRTKYGVDIDELQNLINKITEDTVLIIDGLDHIGRIYNFHQSTMKKVETEIIQVLSSFDFSDHVHVVLASQPISQLSSLTEQGYEVYNIQPWDIEDVQNLLLKNNLEDKVLNKDVTISKMLLAKSNGNPLYLTYLINELLIRKPSYISVEVFEEFPSYDNNLTSYYEYLLSLIPESQKVPQVLAGAPFHLTKKELLDITHLGTYVDESLNAIQSILKQNKCNSGYTVYHESFRRYIIETLEKKEVNVQKIIYNDLIEWLKQNGFYNNRKSFLHLFVLLFESKRYEDILQYCNVEFVVTSLYYGNNIKSIKGNFEILIKTACITRNYGALINCTELSNMIYSLEYSFDENSALYYEVLGLVNGFSKLKDILMYEGQMALELIRGLEVCYLCSRNNNVPDWEPYVNQLINQYKNRTMDNNGSNEKELFRYYICACLDMGWDMGDRLLMVTDEHFEDHRQIVIEEYHRRNEIDSLKSTIQLIPENENWNKSLAFFLGHNDEVDLSNLNQIFDTLKKVDPYSEDSVSAVSFYVRNIKKINQSHSRELDLFLEEIKNRNWFYNWLIFIAEVDRALNDLAVEEFEKRLTSAFEWLTKDTEPFKGSPRACDVYKYDHIIYTSINEPMSYIKTKKTWNEVFNILRKMSKETTTTLQGSPGGPLPTHRFLNMLVQISNKDNFEIIKNMFSEIISKEDKYRFYSYLADYSYKNAIILAKAGYAELAGRAFGQGIVYTLSYSFRKDRTLSHLLDSVLTTYKLDNELGLENILKLKPLADAVVRHTDGKETKTYQREWFELLLSSEIDLALMYLRNELIQPVHNWILEESLELLLQVSNSTLSPKIENVLFKTFPNLITEKFILAYLNNIECLISDHSEKMARRSFKELMSRFDSYDKAEYSNFNLVNRLEELCKRFDIHWSGKVCVRKTKRSNELENLSNDVSVLSVLEGCSYSELLSHIKENGIRVEDYSSVYNYLNQKLNNEFEKEDENFLNGLVSLCFDRRAGDSSSIRLIEIVSNLNLSDEKMAFLYMQIFLHHTDGWYQRFTQTEFFKKAYEYDSKVAEKTFFEHIYHNLYKVDYSLAVGGEIVNSLAAINYNNELVFAYWNNLYEIINFRLSGQLEYDWEGLRKQAKEFDTDEKMFLILLSRFKYGEANRFKWIISELDYLLEDRLLKLKFIKPFIKFIDEKYQYIDYVMIQLLVLIKKRFAYEEIVEFDLQNVLEGIYPTNNSLINYLIRAVNRKKSEEVFCKYNINRKYYDKKISFFMDLVSEVDNRITLLSKYGIDVGSVINSYINEIQEISFVEQKRDIIYNRVFHTLIPNVYFYDVLTRHFGREVEKYLRITAGTPIYREAEIELYDVVLDDIPLMIAQHTSIEPRPQDLEFPEFVEEGYKQVDVNDWIRIGYFEKWYSKIEKYNKDFLSNTEAITILSGIGFGGETSMVPFGKLDDRYRFLHDDEYNYISSIHFHSLKEFLTANISLEDDPYLTYNTKQLLGVRSEILQHLHIQMENSECGIVGISREGEEVIRYSRWEVSHLDDSDCVPYLIGGQLLMKKETFEELCSVFHESPLVYTNKFNQLKE